MGDPVTVTERPTAALLAWTTPGDPERERRDAERLRAYGWTHPVLVDARGGVIAGHRRIRAAHVLGLPSVPTVDGSTWTAAERRAWVRAEAGLSLGCPVEEARDAEEISDLFSL